MCEIVFPESHPLHGRPGSCPPCVKRLHGALIQFHRSQRAAATPTSSSKREKETRKRLLRSRLSRGTSESWRDYRSRGSIEGRDNGKVSPGKLEEPCGNRAKLQGIIPGERDSVAPIFTVPSHQCVPGVRGSERRVYIREVALVKFRAQVGLALDPGG